MRTSIDNLARADGLRREEMQVYVSSMSATNQAQNENSKL
tara:strand:- start:6674 stop:6793 length:120 start_codon:yes stop_codon:yes gene_type:complete